MGASVRPTATVPSLGVLLPLPPPPQPMTVMAVVKIKVMSSDTGGLTIGFLVSFLAELGVCKFRVTDILRPMTVLIRDGDFVLNPDGAPGVSSGILDLSFNFKSLFFRDLNGFVRRHPVTAHPFPGLSICNGCTFSVDRCWGAAAGGQPRT
jgi:hypothetical protein